MNKIIVGEKEIEVMQLIPYAYMQGKGEKVLQIKVSASTATFEQLRNTLEDTGETVKYYEDSVLVCEYVGYGKFEAQYANGIYSVELHKTSLDEQMNALMNANEELNSAIAALEDANTALKEQNAMLESCIIEMSETVYA